MAGYAVYTNESAHNLRSLDLRRSSEFGLRGETKLDNESTVGISIVTEGDRFDSNGTAKIEQSFLYLSNAWGRINIGETEGAANLLQVAAPSADNFIDGISPEINTLTQASGFNMGYKHMFTGSNNIQKLSYLIPLTNGFQLGVSYIPAITEPNKSGLAGVSTTNDINQYDNGLELGARYKTDIDKMSVLIGIGYSLAQIEQKQATTKDWEIWNSGIVLGYDQFNAGMAFLHNNRGIDNGTRKTFVLGADYTFGNYKWGASWQNFKLADGATNPDLGANRFTAGLNYTLAKGISFRSSVSYVDRDNGAAADTNGTQVAVGTVVNF